jgi:hypothetical protein
MLSEFTSLIRQGKIEFSSLTTDDMLELNGVVVVYNRGGDYTYFYSKSIINRNYRTILT